MKCSKTWSKVAAGVIRSAQSAENAAGHADAGAGLVNFTFKDHAQSGDQMVVAFDPAAKKIANLNVNTYVREAKDAVTLIVDFATLPDARTT
jgi:hypothetical protein